MPNFNNYGCYPYGNIYQPPQPNYAQPNLGNMMNNQMQQTPMNQYAYVNGIEGAKSYQLQPNQTIMLMDSDSPICYMKSANGMGQSTLRYFKLIEVSENDLKVNQNSNINTDYVSKAEFEALSKRMDELSLIIQKSENKANEVVNNG